MTRPFYTTEEEKPHFRSVPLPLNFSLEGALRKTSWLAERAFGVVTTRLGLAVRVKTTDFEEVVKLVQPEKYTKFLGELWDVSGLPVSWSPDAVTDFLTGWKVCPVKTFRKGYRRTLVVRALEQPMSTELQHEFGLAVIKRTAMQKARPNPEIQKWVPASDQKKTGRRCSLPTDLGSSGLTASTAKSSGKQTTKTVNRDAGNIPAKQNRI